MNRVRVFAPATVANVAVGFDLLGFPIAGVGDEATVERIAGGNAVEIVMQGEGSESIPTDPLKNCATVPLIQLLADVKPGHGFRVLLKKGIPLGSGMGGSAASAVAALVAANELLAGPLPRPSLLKYAVLGEKIATGAPHADNVSPCLFGGLTLTRGVSDVVPIPLPAGVRCVLVHPHLRLDTRESRGVLKSEVSLKGHVQQSSNLAGFIVACFRNDLELLSRSMNDVLIEPQRAKLIPGFDRAKQAALKAGALGFSISGSGPSVFAWAREEDEQRVRAAIVSAIEGAGVKTDSWISPIGRGGAHVVETS